MNNNIVRILWLLFYFNTQSSESVYPNDPWLPSSVSLSWSDFSTWISY